MKGLTDYLTEQSWEDTIIGSFVLVHDLLPEATRRANFRRRRGPQPEHDADPVRARLDRCPRASLISKGLSVINEEDCR
jgi:hypothetical protein